VAKWEGALTDEDEPRRGGDGLEGGVNIELERGYKEGV
jgi:hypothetical protein